jgi:PAS domain S-box-containing protein
MTVPALDDDALLALLAQQAVIRHDPEGVLTEVTPAAEALLGYPAAELVGAQSLDFVHPEDREAVRAAYRALVVFSPTFSIQLRLVSRSGQVVQTDARYVVVHDAAGVLREVRMTLATAAARGALETLEAQWQMCFTRSSRGITVVDPDTSLMLAVNPALAEMHGTTVEELVGMPVGLLWAPDQHDFLVGLRPRLEASGYIAVEAEQRRVDGSTFPSALEVMAARDARGARLFRVLWIADITERRRAEEDARRRTEELARSNAELDRFAAIVAHDLQAPLRVVSGFAKLLERRCGDALGPEGRDYLAQIVGGVGRAAELLHGVRDYSRVPFGSRRSAGRRGRRPPRRRPREPAR